MLLRRPETEGGGRRHDRSLISDTDSTHQPDTHQQKPRSFKPRKPLALIAAVLLSVFVTGIGGYVLAIRNNQQQLLPHLMPTPTSTSSLTPTPTSVPTPPTQTAPTTTPTWPSTNFSQGISKQPESTDTWETFSSSFGYTIKYPKVLSHREGNGFPYDLQLTNNDLTMTFIIIGLPPNQYCGQF
jgi:hypothetical protein